MKNASFDPYCSCRTCTRKTKKVQIIDFTNPYPEHRVTDLAWAQERNLLQKLVGFFLQIDYFNFLAYSVLVPKKNDLVVVDTMFQDALCIRVKKVFPSKIVKGKYIIEAVTMK